MGIHNFKDLLEAVRKLPGKRLVAVNGVDPNTLEALNIAVKSGLVSAILTGNRSEIEKTCNNLDINVNVFSVIDAVSEKDACEKAVKLIDEGMANVIMKGLISTDKFMKVLLNKEYGLVPHKGTLSHVALMENPFYHKLLFFSDAGVIPYPDLQQKVLLTEYLIKTARAFGIENPKIAVIAPTEQILISMQSCIDGAVIAKMAETGQITGGTVDGPMALDVALNSGAANIKGFSSPVAGDADGLLFPNIDAANVFYKTNSKICNAQMAGIIAGAKIPVVVSSRGDSEKTKLNSIALATLIS
jgi:phosphate butyryltransferase